MYSVVHGWHVDSKSLTACGLGWIYGRSIAGKKPLRMSESYDSTFGVTCKRCLKSKNLRGSQCTN